MPQIVEVGSFTVVGLKVACQAAQLTERRMALWERLRTFASEIPNQTTGRFMDICLFKKGSLVIHCVAMQVETVDIIPDGMTTFSIPAQSYVYTSHQGPAENVQQSLHQIKQWAKEHRCRLDPTHFTIDVTVSEDPPIHAIYMKLEDVKRESIEVVV
ncbi:GyrI-like domain-containing protein [Bacillus thermotolerans]|uniref:GyrI-like domain-containing protein n=1 Tax=Bacillus thermotolerans TaxID=1221996 RepID=UPI00058914BC|nr:effector binding domain-containing protein [Bacillus thermotolerans]KKB44433.1 hypothetical protein QY96_02561 [Bacillus thermotolerans]